MKAGIITQARMTSTRLPGKVLMEVMGETLLGHHVDRLQWPVIPVYIATTVNKEDDPIIDFCEKKGVMHFRGSARNVLERYYQCATENELDIIVRVTSDCPFVDGVIIGDAVELFKKQNDPNVYLSNYLDRTYPRGFDFEVFSFKALEDAWHGAYDEVHFEHVTPYIYENISGKTKFVSYRRNVDASMFRITVDEPDDFTLIKEMIEKFECHKKGAEEIIAVLEDNPYLAKINDHVHQKELGQ